MGNLGSNNGKWAWWEGSVSLEKRLVKIIAFWVIKTINFFLLTSFYAFWFRFGKPVELLHQLQWLKQMREGERCVRVGYTRIRGCKWKVRCFHFFHWFWNIYTNKYRWFWAVDKIVFLQRMIVFLWLIILSESGPLKYLD